jgi:hypothetical protein
LSPGFDALRLQLEDPYQGMPSGMPLTIEPLTIEPESVSLSAANRGLKLRSCHHPRHR